MKKRIKTHSDQQKLFEVKTRIQELIEYCDHSDVGNVVYVEIPRLPDIVREYAPQCFKKK